LRVADIYRSETKISISTNDSRYSPLSQTTPVFSTVRLAILCEHFPSMITSPLNRPHQSCAVRSHGDNTKMKTHKQTLEVATFRAVLWGFFYAPDVRLHRIHFIMTETWIQMSISHFFKCVSTADIECGGYHMWWTSAWLDDYIPETQHDNNCSSYHDFSSILICWP
jgi:hypothetical protein